eukprot:14540803-Ditylum_brightwellii.AAC.1
MAAKDEKFVKTIKEKETKWVTGDLPTMYEHKDLLDFIVKLYNNKKAASEWNVIVKKQTNKLATTEDT